MLLTTQVRASDIVMHETPSPRRISKMVKALLAGAQLPPIEVSAEVGDVRLMGPQGMYVAGHGHFLLDGHHRLAARCLVYGKDVMVTVVQR